MANQTIKAKGNTLSGSIGAGMGSLFNPGGRKYYILEHKVSSKYHKQGESQEIIVDTIELGRDSHCQVRFDERFNTVSRRHAAIVKEGDGWKLVQLSKTNTTFLNGQPIKNEWYLQNGDEIQLSVNGPKLGFIIPTGSKATVGSIGLTRRLSLFRQQAMRPYKNAIAALCAVLVLSVGGLTTWNLFLNDKVSIQEGQIAEMRIINDSLQQEITANNKKISGYEERSRTISNNARSAYQAALNVKRNYEESEYLTPTKELQKYYPNIYFVKVTFDNLKQENGTPLSFLGTAFLLEDGRLVTAQHMVDFWSFVDYGIAKDSLGNKQRVVNMNGPNTYLNYLAHNIKPLEITWDAYSSSGDHIQYKYTSEGHPFTVGKVETKKMAVQDDVIPFIEWVLEEKKFSVNGSDWAYIQTDRKGGLKYEKNAITIPATTKLDILGFPYGRGGENTSHIQPIYSASTVARDGIDTNGTIMLSNEDTQGGNSGGPAFVKKQDGHYVVGILTGSHIGKDCLVPISNIR